MLLRLLLFHIIMSKARVFVFQLLGKIYYYFCNFSNLNNEFFHLHYHISTLFFNSVYCISTTTVFPPFPLFPFPILQLCVATVPINKGRNKWVKMITITSPIMATKTMISIAIKIQLHTHTHKYIRTHP